MPQTALLENRKKSEKGYVMCECWNGFYRLNATSNHPKRLSAPRKDDANHEGVVDHSNSCCRGSPDKLLGPTRTLMYGGTPHMAPVP